MRRSQDPDEIPAFGRVTRFSQGMSQFMKCRWCRTKLQQDKRRGGTFVKCPKCDAPDTTEASPLTELAGK